MKQFNSEAYNQFYVPTEVKLTTANAKMFNCNFVTRENATQFHFYPKLKPLDSVEQKALFDKYVAIIGEALEKILGKKSDYLIDVVNDGVVEANIFVGVNGFGENHDLSRTLIEKLITFVHEKTDTSH